jgi:2-keto-4-pentenoate hydratase
MDAGASIEELAARLARAHVSGERVPSPTAARPGLDLDGAYAIQEALLGRLLATGQQPIGWKVGMAGVVGRNAATPGPIYGRLTSDMVVADGGTLPARTLHEPFAEGEIAFILRERLRGPGIEAEHVLAASGGVCPAIEVFARRLDADASAITDMVADNALCAHVVLGDVTDRDLPALRLVGLVLARSGEIVATGAGAQVLGDPARSVAWLANALAERGVGIEPGEIVITGAVAGAHAVSPGDTFTAEFDRLGAVQVHCA